MCTAMLSQLEFLQSFVADMLDLRQLKSGIFNLAKEPFEIASMLQYLHDIFEP